MSTETHYITSMMVFRTSEKPRGIDHTRFLILRIKENERIVVAFTPLTAFFCCPFYMHKIEIRRTHLFVASIPYVEVLNWKEQGIRFPPYMTPQAFTVYMKNYTLFTLTTDTEDWLFPFGDKNPLAKFFKSCRVPIFPPNITSMPPLKAKSWRAPTTNGARITNPYTQIILRMPDAKIVAYRCLDMELVHDWHAQLKVTLILHALPDLEVATDSQDALATWLADVPKPFVNERKQLMNRFTDLNCKRKFAAKMVLKSAARFLNESKQCASDFIIINTKFSLDEAMLDSRQCSIDQLISADIDLMAVATKINDYTLRVATCPGVVIDHNNIHKRFYRQVRDSSFIEIDMETASDRQLAFRRIIDYFSLMFKELPFTSSIVVPLEKDRTWLLEFLREPSISYNFPPETQFESLILTSDELLMKIDDRDYCYNVADRLQNVVLFLPRGESTRILSNLLDRIVTPDHPSIVRCNSLVIIGCPHLVKLSGSGVPLRSFIYNYKLPASLDPCWIRKIVNVQIYEPRMRPFPDRRKTKVGYPPFSDLDKIIDSALNKFPINLNWESFNNMHRDMLITLLISLGYHTLDEKPTLLIEGDSGDYTDGAEYLATIYEKLNIHPIRTHLEWHKVIS